MFGLNFILSFDDVRVSVLRQIGQLQDPRVLTYETTTQSRPDFPDFRFRYVDQSRVGSLGLHDVCSLGQTCWAINRLIHSGGNDAFWLGCLQRLGIPPSPPRNYMSPRMVLRQDLLSGRQGMIPNIVRIPLEDQEAVASLQRRMSDSNYF